MKSRADVLAEGPAASDPIVSIKWSAADLNVSRATWYRVYRPVVAIVEVSDRRRGLRLSEHERLKAARTRPGRVA